MALVIAFIAAIMCGVLLVCIVCDVYVLICSMRKQRKQQ